MADLVGTQSVNIVSTSSSQLGSIIIPTSDTVTAGTITPGLTGVMRFITLTTPAMTGTGTATVRIVDAAGGTLFSQAQNESVVSAYGSIVPLTSTMIMNATANGTQSSAATVVYSLYYDK
jgi:hypothetical protein